MHTDLKAGTLQATINLAGGKSEDDGNYRPTPGFRLLSGRETPNNRFLSGQSLPHSALCDQPKKNQRRRNISLFPRVFFMSHTLPHTLQSVQGCRDAKRIVQNPEGYS